MRDVSVVLSQQLCVLSPTFHGIGPNIRFLVLNQPQSGWKDFTCDFFGGENISIGPEVFGDSCQVVVVDRATGGEEGKKEEG